MTRLIAIIGAGISGLACARALADMGANVVVFEKSRGPGGRMSTRRTGDDLVFDHGAQYLTVRGGDFQRETDHWRSDGTLATWPIEPRVFPFGSKNSSRRPGTPSDSAALRLVGTPSMNAPLKKLAEGLDCRFQVRITEIRRDGANVQLLGEDAVDLGTFGAVVCSAPAPQAKALLESISPKLAEVAANARMAPCWATLLSFDQPIDVGFVSAFVNEGPIAWAARNSSKPQRPSQETWILHSTGEWATANLESSPEVIAPMMLAAFERLCSSQGYKGLLRPTHLSSHRWRYALTEVAASAPCLYEPSAPVVVCGDWCMGSRIEDAWRSGRAAAERILAMLAEGDQVESVT